VDQNTFPADGEAGSGSAFPSRLTYFVRDTGMDAELRDKAATEVKFRRGLHWL